MANTLHNTLYQYLLVFTNKFKEGENYYWPSTLGNAQSIFFYYLEKKFFQEIIFADDTPLEQDLDFLSEDIREILQITKEDNYSEFPYVTDNEKSEILKNFRNHVISNWHMDEIFFSCGVYCCMEQLKSEKVPTIDFYFSIYDFLLTNSFSLQFYFFLKQNHVLLQHKKKASIAVMTYLSQKCCTIQYNKKQTITFLENFILIWDLLEYDLSDYLALKKQCTNEIELNKVELNPTKVNTYFTQYFDIYSIKQYISNKTYRT